MITSSTNKSLTKLKGSLNKPFIQFLFVGGLILQFSACTKHTSSQENGIIQNNWHPLETIDEEGLLDEMVERLLATQLPDGYLGTYGEAYTFMAVPENGMINRIADDIQPEQKKANIQLVENAPEGGWDTWTIRYNLYGLLTYEKYFPKIRVRLYNIN